MGLLEACFLMVSLLKSRVKTVYHSTKPVGRIINRFERFQTGVRLIVSIQSARHCLLSSDVGFRNLNQYKIGEES